MGDPRKVRRKYEGPGHPWVASRLESERELKKSFGTKNKKELYKMETALKRFKDQAKQLSSRVDAQAEKEQQQMVDKLVGLGLIKIGAGLDDILGLSVVDLMNRRLQTILVKRLLARTTSQARQFIAHGHVVVGGSVITSPGYIVSLEEEAKITFRGSSAFNNEQHPERFSEEELTLKAEREKAKAAKKRDEESEEAPPAYKEEELEDPEEATTVKPAEVKPTKNVAVEKVTKVESKDSEEEPKESAKKAAEPETKESEPKEAKSEEKTETSEEKKDEEAKK